jgi:DNA-binding NarL/FixJ family response regulator
MSIRVLIADDHPLFRSGVRNELSSHSEIVVIGEAPDGNQALRMAEELHPDILFLDINMPGIKTTQIVSRLKRVVPETLVIILTAYDDSHTVLVMLKEGVKGYMVKDENPELLLEAIRAVMRGKTWLSPTVADIVTKTLSDKKALEQSLLLTDRELEILQLLGQGYCYAEIGQELFLSERLVRYEVGRILEKMEVHNRAEAVGIAVRDGWIRV